MLSRQTKSRLVFLMKADRNSFPKDALEMLITLPDSQRPDVYSYIHTNDILRPKFCACLYGHELSTLGKNVFSYNRFLKKDTAFEYACFLVGLYADKVNHYIKLRKMYEQHYLLGEYSQARDILSVIDSQICVSLWSCGQHMLLQELEAGLTENKRLLDQYSHTVPNNYITQAILYYYSALAEENTSFDNYQTQISKFLKQMPDSVLKEYLSQKLFLAPPSPQDDFSLILQIDSQFSIIDLFNDIEIFIPVYYYDKICTGNILEPFLQHFAFTINTPVAKNIRKLLSLVSENTISDFDSVDDIFLYSIIEQYTMGNYQWVIENAKTYLFNKPYDFQIAVLFCKALIHSNNEFPKSFPISYIKSIYSIYKIDENCKESVLAIKKYIKQNHGFTLRIKMQSFINRKDTIHPGTLLFYSGLLDEGLHPNIVQFLCDPLANAFSNYLSNVCPNAIALTNILDAHRLDYSIQDFSFSSVYRPFLAAEYACKNENYVEAEAILLAAENSCTQDDMYTCERILRSRLKIFGHEKKYAEAIHTLVDSYFQSEILFDRLIAGIDFSFPSRTRNTELEKHIDYVIFVYLSQRTNYHKQISAYNNFLDLNHYTTIRQYLKSAPLCDARCKFFLEKVCTINLLKRDVSLCALKIAPETVRLEILKELYKHFPQKNILDEIQEISTNDVIRDNLRNINSSKINIDVDKIYTYYQSQWEENYKKYIQLSKSLAKVVNLDMTDESFKSLADKLNLRIKNSPDVNQGTVVLKGIIEQIVDACLYNAQYGLETYLSSRLRHGYCKEQLSSFLNELNLISLRDANEEQYLVNEYWEKKTCTDPVLSQRILYALSTFTAKIEQKIEEVRGEWLRIKNHAHPHGLFDYAPLVNTYLVAYQYEYINEFHIFYKRVIDMFWIITNSCLDTIRTRIKEELQEYYIETVDELERSINAISCGSTSTHITRELLQKCALAKSKVVSVMQEFQNVFSINKSAYKNFYMHDLSDSCKRITEKLFPNSSTIRWKINADSSLLFDGNCFASFVDILCILLNNSITHSGFNNMSKLAIDININQVPNDERADFFEATSTVDESQKLIILSVTNNVAPTVDMKSLESKLRSIFEAIRSEQNGAFFIQSEGGSGLYKFAKTADYNIEAKYCILYSVEGNTVTIGYEFIADKLLVKEHMI